jgi:GTPase SAR1 family protein
MKNIKRLLLTIPITRELLFFLFQKKVYRSCIDRKIECLLSGKLNLNGKMIGGLIVSLTSFPERINEIKYTIFSLLDQSIHPEKIVLWLAESQFQNKENDLPKELLAFKMFGLDIQWCEDIRSYKKLIPALEKYPDYYIITADDDIYYRKRWLQKLWECHLKYPGDIICHIANKIKFDNDGSVMPYTKWKYNIKSKNASCLFFQLGVGGVLYHKKFLFSDISNKDLFLKLAPYADDVWFYFMAVLKNIKIRVAKHPCNKVRYVDPYREYNLAKGYKLTTINIENNQNDVQFKNVMQYYNASLNGFVNTRLEEL